jgi:single-strand DNA-binding protein
MAGETVITVVGNLTDDPELRFTPSGAAVANFTVASTPRTLDKQTNEWKDGDALFLRCSIWRQAAENVAESLTRGMRVIVSGRLRQRSYETKEGEKRTVVELDVEEIGPSLKYATAKVTKANRPGGQGGGGGGGGGWSGNSGGGGNSGGSGGGGGGWGGNSGGNSGGGSGWGGNSGGNSGGSPSGGGGNSGGGGGGTQGGGNDPWASGGDGGWGNDEPPF